jgi:uracil-DNA glycosylase family 4
MTDVLARLAIKQQILNCTNCSLHQTATKPVPFSGPSPSEIAVIGEAPGRYEDVLNRPFVGPSGQLARKWLADAGIGVEVAWLNTVCCYPDRTPTSREVGSCRPNLQGQLAVIRPDFCLVFGGIAVSAFHPSTRLGEVRGQWWRLPYLVPCNHGSAQQDNQGILYEAWAIATWHPAAVLRNRSLEQEVVADIARFLSLRPLVSETCIKCKREIAVEWVNDLGYCYKHNLFRKGEAYGRKAQFEKGKAVKQPGRRQTKMPLP